MGREVEVKKRTVKQEPDSQVWSIKSGSKHLTLELLNRGKRASARLDTVENKDRVPGETTVVFQQAKEILEKEVEKCGIKVHCEIKNRWQRLV